MVTILEQLPAGERIESWWTNLFASPPSRQIRVSNTIMAQAIKQLPEKERLVISLYYLDELTMKETGQVLGITESRVSQIHSQAILHLRAKLRKQNLLDE